MILRVKIINFIEKEYKKLGFTHYLDYEPVLAFKLTNIDSKASNSFKVDSVDEAENLVISFSSISKKREIFINDSYDENKNLYLKVKVIIT